MVVRALPLLCLAFVVTSGSHAPSEARFDGPIGGWDRAADCGVCHTEQHATWSTSAHAHASLVNPWYLSAFEAVRDEEGVAASRHCSGCHEPLLLGTGASDGDFGPDHPDAGEGVTCLVCHGIQETGYGGNADLRIAIASTDPVDGLAAHRARMRPEPLRDGTVCRGCHRGFVVPEIGGPAVMLGFDDWGEWEASSYAGASSARFEPVRERTTCIDCHFQDGHTVPGGRTALGGQTGSLEATLGMLRQAVEVRIPVAWVEGERARLDGPFAPERGQEVVLDVAVRNVGAGHSFPGGLADTQDIWLRVDVAGRRQTLVAGRTSEEGMHFRSLPLDGDGTPERRHRPHRMGTGGFDHSIPAGEVGLVRVAFTAPGGPLDVRASVMHRSHRPELHDAACAVSGPDTLDGCIPQQTAVIAEGRLGPVGPTDAYVHALGMSRGLQEEVGEGLVSLAGMDDPASRVLRARILGIQGRADDALAAVDGLDPSHPSVWRVRGDASARVWRWADAARAYGELVRLRPDDPAGWRDLAVARGSLGDAHGSVEAADRGLALQPRDPSLLRSRALGLQALGHADAAAALDRWDADRELDHASSLRARCDGVDAECAAERTPIPIVRATVRATGP